MAVLPDLVTVELTKLLQFGIPYPLAIELAWRPRLDMNGELPVEVFPAGISTGGTPAPSVYDGGTATSVFAGVTVDGGSSSASFTATIDGGPA